MDDFPRIASPPWTLRTRRTVSLILLGIVGLFAWRLADMWPPIIIATILAYLLTPLVNAFQDTIPFGSKRIRRTLATILAFVVSVLIITLIILLIVPAITEQTRQFGQAIPTLVEKFEQNLDGILSQPIQIGGRTIVPADVFSGLLGTNVTADITGNESDLLAVMLQSLLGPLATPVLGVLGTALSAVLTMVFVLTMWFYLMKDGPRFLEVVEVRVPESYREDFHYLLEHLGHIWNAYLRGQLVLSLVMGTLVFFVATILGVRSPLVLGVLSGILEFIPNIGPVIAAIPAMAFALFFPSSTVPGLDGLLFMLIVAAVWTGLQSLESAFLVPRIMGESLDLHPFIVIVAVIGGTVLAGALGVILAAPVVATLRLLADYFYVKIVRPERTRYPVDLDALDVEYTE